MADIWFRYEDVQYASPVDEFDNPTGEGTLRIELNAYEVVKITPKGVRLNMGCESKNQRFVLANATKRFACPTQEEALLSFIARKQRQAGILRRQLRRSEQAINLGVNLLG